jgi:hypothetical protein
MFTHTTTYFSRTISIVLFLVCFLTLCTFTVAHAGGGGSSSSGGGSSSSGNSSSGSSNSSYQQAQGTALSQAFSTPGPTLNISVHSYSGGNQSSTYGSNCVSCTSSTSFYSNGNGTYNTITTYTPSGGSSNSGSSSGGGSSLSSAGGGGNPTSPSSGGGGGPSSSSCAALGLTFYNGQCYLSSSCSTVSSGKGGSTTTCSGTPANVIIGPAPSNNGNNNAAAGTAPTVSIIALPAIVRIGGQSRLTWNGGTARACSLSGTDGYANNTISGTTIINNITEPRTYTIICTRGGLSATASTTVKIVPLWREF